MHLYLVRNTIIFKWENNINSDNYSYYDTLQKQCRDLFLKKPNKFEQA